MSYTENKNLQSSTGIAVLASLGVHGLLWAVLPGLTVDSQANKSPSQRTIGLVNLSPQEQSRLPQTPNPVDNNLPSFASQITDLPPLPPAPPYQTSVIPPLQLPPGSAPIYNTIPNQISTPPLQTFQVPLPPPPNTSFPPIPYENIPNYTNNAPLPSPPQAQPFVLPSNNGLPNIPLAADRTLPEGSAISTAIPSPATLPPTPASSNTPSSTVEGNKLPERGKQELLAMRESMRNNFPAGVATPTPTTPRLSSQEIAAALKRQRSNQPTPPNQAMSRQEVVTALRGSRNSSGELSPETKTALDNLEKFTQQQAIVQAQNPGAVTKPPIRRKLSTCDRAIDGDVAVVNVVVNQEGKRLSEPSLVTKTGKPDISQAQNYVRAYEFAKTDTTSNYNFWLEFNYSANKCALAKPNSSPNNTPEATSNTTNTSTPNPSSSQPIPTFRPTPPSSKPIPTSRTTPSSSQPIPTFRPTPPSLKPIPTSPNDSVTPTPESTTTPQSEALPIDPSKPSF